MYIIVFFLVAFHLSTIFHRNIETGVLSGPGDIWMKYRLLWFSFEFYLLLFEFGRLRCFVRWREVVIWRHPMHRSLLFASLTIACVCGRSVGLGTHLRVNIWPIVTFYDRHSRAFSALENHFTNVFIKLVIKCCWRFWLRNWQKIVSSCSKLWSTLA